MLTKIENPMPDGSQLSPTKLQAKAVAARMQLGHAGMQCHVHSFFIKVYRHDLVQDRFHGPKESIVHSMSETISKQNSLPCHWHCSLDCNCHHASAANDLPAE